MSLLEASRLYKIYSATGGLPGGGMKAGRKISELPALVDVSLKLRSGSSLGLVGESGAGKTTLAQIVAGLIPPSRGEVKIDGTVISARPPSRRLLLKQARLVQLIWQDALGSLNPRMRVKHAIAEPLRIHRLLREKSACEQTACLLNEVDLPAELGHRFPHELSGGQAQRVAIARALAIMPRLLVCDEPASALDLRLKMQIAELLERLRRQKGLTYLIITHDLLLANKLTDHLAVMYRGRLVERGPTSAVLDNPLHPYTRLLVDSAPELSGLLVTGKNCREVIGGEQIDNASGCCFRNGCSVAGIVCRERPELTWRDGGRWVACWLAPS